MQHAVSASSVRSRSGDVVLRLKLLRSLKSCLDIFSGFIRLARKDSLIRLKDHPELTVKSLPSLPHREVHNKVKTQ